MPKEPIGLWTRWIPNSTGATAPDLTDASMSTSMEPTAPAANTTALGVNRLGLMAPLLRWVAPRKEQFPVSLVRSKSSGYKPADLFEEQVP